MDFKQLMQRKTLVLMLGITGLFSRFDVNLPTKWYSIIETLQVSTGVLHSRLSCIDRDAQREYEELETNLERQLGIESFYSPDEIEEIKDQVEKEIQTAKLPQRPY